MKKLFSIILVVAFTTISYSVIAQVKVNELKKQEQKQEQKVNAEVEKKDKLQESGSKLNTQQGEVNSGLFDYEKAKKHNEERYKAGKISKEEYDATNIRIERRKVDDNEIKQPARKE